MKTYNDELIKKEIDEKLIFITYEINHKTTSKLIFGSKQILKHVICQLKEVYDLYDNIFSYNKGLVNIHNTLISIEEIVEINNKYYDESID